MTPEFGAPTQLEKIDMLDFADVVAINKLERAGGDDALRDVAKQVQRNREAFGEPPESMPVFGTIASALQRRRRHRAVPRARRRARGEGPAAGRTAPGASGVQGQQQEGGADSGRAQALPGRHRRRGARSARGHGATGDPRARAPAADRRRAIAARGRGRGRARGGRAPIGSPRRATRLSVVFFTPSPCPRPRRSPTSIPTAKPC